MQSADDLRLLLSTAISLAMIWILASSVRVQGKSWLIGFICLLWLLSAIWLLPASLLRNNSETLNAYHEFLNSGRLFLRAADVFSWVFLLTFVLKLRPAMGDPSVEAVAAESEGNAKPRRWPGYVAGALAAVWLVQWLYKVSLGGMNRLDAFDFSQPSLLSMLGVASIVYLLYLMVRRKSP